MKKLNEYETPETVKACNTVKNLSDFIAFAEDLERRLAMCWDALKSSHDLMLQVSPLVRVQYEGKGSVFYQSALINNEETLKATEPK